MKAGKRIMAVCAITLPIGLAVVVPSGGLRVDRHRRRSTRRPLPRATGSSSPSRPAMPTTPASRPTSRRRAVVSCGRCRRWARSSSRRRRRRRRAWRPASTRPAWPRTTSSRSCRPRWPRPGPRHRVQQVNLASNSAPTPDPASSIPGLLWNQQRINMTDAWKVTAGDPAVTVGVADTGLDYTHSELAPKVSAVVDFTGTEDPPICKTFFTPSASDADWAAQFGGPANTDWNGHGSWIGGNIAAVLDGAGINGIAPKVNLVALKISQWCGSAYDSEILAAFVYAADHGINIVSISFGGYLDKSDPDQALILKQYEQVVKYANNKGTTIVAAAGNEHVRVNGNGKVVTHGPLTTPGTTPADFATGDFGLYEVPGGIKGVVDVASTGNLVNASSPTLPAAARRTTPTSSASRPPTRTSRPASGPRTSWPTTATTGRGSTSPRRVAPASSTCPCGTAEGRPASPTRPPTARRRGRPSASRPTGRWRSPASCSRAAASRPTSATAPSRGRRWRRRTLGGAGPDRQRQAEPRPQPGGAGQAARPRRPARSRATPRRRCRRPTCRTVTRAASPAPRATATSVDPPSPTRRRTAPAS